MTQRDTKAKRMPVVFIGHGSPMHALHDNDYTRALGRLGRELGRPKAVVCVSAHWQNERRTRRPLDSTAPRPIRAA